MAWFVVHGDWRGWLSLTRSRRWSPLHISISAVRTTPCWGAQGSRRCRPMMPCRARSLPRRQTWTMRRSRTNFLPRSCCCSWSTSNHRPGSHGGGEGGEKKRNRRKARRQGLTGGLQLGPNVSITGPPWNGLRVRFDT